MPAALRALSKRVRSAPEVSRWPFPSCNRASPPHEAMLTAQNAFYEVFQFARDCNA